VDNTKRHQLKQDKFVETTRHGLEWASEHRDSVVRSVGILVAVVVIAFGSIFYYNYRSDAAAVAFGTAMQTYGTPLAAPGEPVPEGVKTFATAQDRAKAAFDQFSAVAHQYGWTPAGRNAEYFAGLNAIELGQNASAEQILLKVSHGLNRDLAASAKVALAALYHQTGRDAEAIVLYQQLIDKPASTVTSGMAQLQLASLYESSGRDADAKKIYAALKDKDKGAAGELAAQKLGGQ
jgi:tetratricopeptide (TPR) repeat protein